ncbi:MAG TPA: TIM barrel protein [Verrucomicrobiae bacterium]
MIPLRKRPFWVTLLPVVTTALLCAAGVLSVRGAEDGGSTRANIFARSNLVAWCIVPFDAKKRDSLQRAEMLERLQIRRLAYDYRAEHVPTFDLEVETMKKHGIEVTAWWFPGSLNEEAKKILGVIERHKIMPQLWITGGGAATKNEEEQRQRVVAEANRIRPIAEAAGRLGCKVALYNHGGWFGEPENQVAIIKELNLPNVGIVYNFHHGHEHIARFPELMALMKPHLLALNINGMIPGGDKAGKKILTVGEGTEELAMLKTVKASGWQGPVGILNHRTELDAEVALKGNLAGLEKLAAALK